jgi:hypothetical protein
MRQEGRGSFSFYFGRTPSVNPARVHLLARHLLYALKYSRNGKGRKMTNAELNTKAAEIMGLVYANPDYVRHDDRGRYVIHPSDWNPCEHIAQAFEVAERVGILKLVQWGKDEWIARIIPHFTGTPYYSDRDKLSKPALAITRACVAAWQNKEK